MPLLPPHNKLILIRVFYASVVNDRQLRLFVCDDDMSIRMVLLVMYIILPVYSFLLYRAVCSILLILRNRIYIETIFSCFFT